MSRLFAALLLAATAAVHPTPRTDTDGVPLPDGAIARLGSARFRSGGTPWCPVAFSPDGKQLAVTDTAAVTVFETATGRRLHRIVLPDKYHPRSVRFLPDGRHLGIGSGDWQRTAEWTVHDLATGKVLATTKFTGKSQIFVIDASADGSRVLVEDRFVRVFLWDIPANREVWSVEHKEATSTLPFTADGKHFVVSGYKKAELFDATTGKVVGQFPDPGPQFRERYQPGFAPDGRLALGSDKGDTVAVLAARGEPRVRLLAAAGRAGRLTFSPDAHYLVAPDEGLTQVWNLTLPDDKGPVARLPGALRAGFSPDGKTLALTGDGSTTLYSVGDWKLQPQSAAPVGAVRRVWFADDGRRVLGQTQAGWVAWPAGGGPMTRLSDDARVYLDGPADVTPDGRWAADVLIEPGKGPDRATYALRGTDLTTGKAIRIPLEENAWAPVSLSPDGRQVSAYLANVAFFVWDARTGAVLSKQPAEADRMLLGALTAADGKGFAYTLRGTWNRNARGPGSGPSYTAVTVTDHAAGRKWDLNPMPLSVYSGGGRFTRDGTRMVLHANYDFRHQADSVSVWDVRTGRRLMNWERPGYVQAVRPADDCRSVLVGAGDGQLTLVEVATGAERAVFRHGSRVLSAAFQPDGTKVVSSSPVGPVYVWDLLGKPGPWEPAKADALWTDLVSPDAKVAFAAIRTLRANPAEAVAFLKDRVKLPGPPPDETVAKWVKGLDAPRFAERERSQRELTAVAELIRPKLEAARKGASEEAGRRLDQVLKDTGTVTPENLRRVRACEVLEGIGTPGAFAVLKTWAAGPPGARLTVEAKESVQRRR